MHRPHYVEAHRGRFRRGVKSQAEERFDGLESIISGEPDLQKHHGRWRA
jgi:hypothetical protein